MGTMKYSTFRYDTVEVENGLKGPKSEGHFKEYPYFEPDLLLKSNKRSWFLIRITSPPQMIYECLKTCILC